MLCTYRVLLLGCTVDAQIDHDFGTKDMVGLAGWCLLLVGKFLALQALCNLVDWLEAPPKKPSEKRGQRGKRGTEKRKDAGGRKSARTRRKEDYDEVDEDEDEGEKDDVEEEAEEEEEEAKGEEEQTSDDDEGNGASSGDDSDSDRDRRRRTSGRSAGGSRSRRSA